MGSFLTKFGVDGRFGVAGGMLGKARAAGYSDKQIAVAIARDQHRLKIGQAIRPGSALHTQMATSGRGKAGNWIHHYQNPSGAVGVQGLEQALAAGYTPEQLIGAGHLTAGGTTNYGIPGFGLQASKWLEDYMKPDEPEPDGPMEMAVPGMPQTPDQKYRVDNTAGYTAEGLNTPLPPGAELNTGGYGEAFSRSPEDPASSTTPITEQGKYRKKPLNPAMMINPLTV